MPAAPTPRSRLIDTHVHVFDPARFPYGGERRYTPGPAELTALRAHQARLGIGHTVLVQPSVYGTDNGCLLDVISQLGQDRCRGISVIDMDHASRGDLLTLHAAGVRGIRLNLEVRRETDTERTRAELARAAALVDLPGWCVQVHCAAALLPTVAAVLPSFRVPLVLDHWAGLGPADATRAGGALDSLRGLLATGLVYVKLSAFYRASADTPTHADLAPLARRLMATRPDRLLWGSDWPHTGGGAARNPQVVEPFRDIDLAASLSALRGWAPDAACLQRLLFDNAAALYGFSPDAAP